MSFLDNLHHTADVKINVIGLNEKIFNDIEDLANKSGFTRLISPLAGGYVFLSGIVEVVSQIGETLIKGLTNLFGAPFSERCNALRGVKQLFIKLPIKVVFAVFDIAYFAILSVVVTIGVTVSPSFTGEWARRFEKYRGSLLEEVIAEEEPENFLKSFYQFCNS